jgi:hypothetical protein
MANSAERTSGLASLPSRFIQKIAVDDDGCWVWTGARQKRGGYGLVRIGSRVDGSTHAALVHRVVFEMLRSKVDDGLELDHLCRVRACCNPDHLEPVTHAENVRRGRVGDRERRRTHCPQGHPYSHENTILYRGSRSCRQCGRECMRRVRDRRRADWIETGE